jgi:L-seryl-tRNA(Ser) seleniumtransferase
LIDYAQFGLPGEPLASESLKAGVDLVLFSGDKLLGGSQAGIIAGKRDLIDKIERDPLMRTYRLDKLALAALEATLRLFLRPDIAMREVPVLRQLGLPMIELRKRAKRIAKNLPGATVRDDVTFVGGGSIPDQSYPTVVVALRPRDGDSDEALAKRLRVGRPAVLARVKDGEVLLDMRSVMKEQMDDLIDATKSAFGS